MLKHNLENNFKKSAIITVGILSVIFVLYFIFFCGRKAVAPTVSVENVKNITPVSAPKDTEPSADLKRNTVVGALEPDTIEFISNEFVSDKAATSSLATSSPIKKGPIKKNINISVPFTPQAPLANWKDQRQEDGCEEAVSLMAMAWVNSKDNETKLTAADWEEKIIALSDFEQEKYGEYRDVTLSDMIDWIFKDYFAYEKVSVKKVASSTDILDELKKGNIVLTPVNGQKLKNPYFTAPGPLTHMILIKGYDYATKEFITNDPGTKRGADYRYPENILFGAISVYPTGSHEEIKKIEKAAIIVARP